MWSLKMINDQYLNALDDAILTMLHNDIEPTSALKQCASDNGIAYGEDTGKFIEWAKEQLLLLQK